jgi:hypothetical protein
MVPVGRHDHAGKRLFRVFAKQRVFRDRPAVALRDFDLHRHAAERAQYIPVRRIAG